MSVKELKLAQDQLNTMRVNRAGNHVCLTTENTQKQSMFVMLDRNQAHLLKLFLEEHLK